MDIDLVPKYKVSGNTYITLADYCEVFEKPERTVKQAVWKGELVKRKINGRVFIKI